MVALIALLFKSSEVTWAWGFLPKYLAFFQPNKTDFVRDAWKQCLKEQTEPSSRKIQWFKPIEKLRV